ncbi:hypothetical protein GCM10027037_00940 [Mucilaginibacter koreensis]
MNGLKLQYLKRLITFTLQIITATAMAKPAPAVFYKSVRDTAVIYKLVQEGLKHSKNLNAKAPAYLLQVIKLCDNKADAYSIKQYHTALNSLGGYYTFKGNHDSSAYFYNRLMLSGQAHHNPFAIATANIGYGLIADYQADYETAINRNMLALQYFEQVKDTTAAAIIMGNLANSYIRIKQYQKAVNLLNAALNINLQKGLTRIAANNMANMARAYKGLGNRTKELELKLKAFGIFKVENYKKGMATVAINLGVFYENDNNFKEAQKYYHIALKCSREIQDKGNIAILFNNMSSFYLKLNKLDTAVLYNDSAAYYAGHNGDKLSQADAAIYKANILHTLGRHAEADEYYDKYALIRDTIYNNRMQRQVAEMEVKYETEKKENTIALLNQQNNIKSLQLKNSQLQLGKDQLQLVEQNQTLLINTLNLKNKDQQLTNQRLDADKNEQRIKALREQAHIQALGLENRKLQITQRNYAITFILLLLAAGTLLGYLYYSRYKTQQENRIKNEIFKQQEVAAKALFDGEQSERIRIARDLHDSVGQMLAVVKMNLTTANQQPEAAGWLDKTTRLVDQTIQEVRYISHNLIPEELNFGLFNALEDLGEKVNGSGGTQVVVDIPDEVRHHQFEKSNELSIYRIVQEVLSNMVRHAQATLINLSVLPQHNQMLLVIKDNGKGFDTATIPTSTGLGWKNIAARVNLLDGSLQVRSQQLSGTQIEIIIPG